MGTLTLGLYNSYHPTEFQDAMRRAVARAAPVCIAFDCNLATFGFPFAHADKALTSPRAVAEFIATSTSIGGGEAIKQLASERRFRTYDFPQGMFPPQLGTPILTSERADGETPRGVAQRLHNEDILLVLGLGPHGLPQVLFEGAETLEITGKNVALETATAMAALPALVHAYR
ncbi:MAG: DUF531 family protein [Thermoplasmatota archaeon]